MPKKKIKGDTKCPICQKDRKGDEFEVHHVIPRVHGGSDDPVNLLPICATCHAIVTRACREDMVPRDMACFFHQLGQYGLEFLLKSGIKGDDRIWGKYIKGEIDLDPETLDDQLREAGWTKYFEYIDKIQQQAYFISLPQMIKWGPPRKLAALAPY